MCIKDLFKRKIIEQDKEAFHPISSDDAKIIREQGNLEKHEILQLVDRVQCTSCHEYSKRGVTDCDCGKILDGISAEAHEQVGIIITDSFKSMVTPCGLVWKRSLVRRGERIAESR